MVKQVNEADFQKEVLESGGLSVVDFYADWCKPCKRILPTLEEIATEKSGEVLVCKVDVDQSQQLASAFQVMSIPNIISFKNGEMYKRAMGAVSKEELLNLVE